MTPRNVAGKLVLLVFVLGARVSSESPSDPEAGGLDPEDDSELGDLLAEESHPSFSYLAPPPGLKAPPPREQRNWRFSQSPRRLPPHVNPSHSFPVRQPSQYPNPAINLDFRFDPYTGKRDHSYGTPPRRRPKPGHNFNPYATLDDSRKNGLQTHQRPQAPFSGFETISEPSSSSQYYPARPPDQRRPYGPQGQPQDHMYRGPDENHENYGQEHHTEIQNEHGGQDMYYGHGKQDQNNDQDQIDQHTFYIPEEPSGEREQHSSPTGFQNGGIKHGDEAAQIDLPDIFDHHNKNENHNNNHESTQDSNIFPDIDNNKEIITQSQQNPRTDSHDVPKNQPTPKSHDEAVPDKTTEDPTHHGVKMEDLDTPPNPRNLAALLAGASSIGLKQSKSEEERKLTNLKRPQDQQNAEPNEKPSKSRTSIPEHIKSSTTDHSGVEYYDELYDEFVDMYFDAEGKQVGTNTTDADEKTTSQQPKESEAKSRKPDSSQSEVQNKETISDKKEPTQRPKMVRITLRSTTPKPRLATRRMPTNPTTVPTRKTTTIVAAKKESVKEETSPSRVTTSAISLSEILQELGLGLPQFLATLKVHGTSLKEFTEKLKAKSLSKSEFRRAKGNVKKLLEILDGNLDRNVKEKESKSELRTTTETTSSETLKRTTTSLPDTTPVESTEKEESETTTEKSEETENTSVKKPRVFGSRPTGIMFARPNKKKSEEEEPEGNSSNSQKKRPIAIDLDISKLVKEQGVSAEGILQNFKTMFNISAKSSSESREKESSSVTPRTTDETTVSLRPYRTSAERSRTYRPFGYEGGNRNIHRGIINSRLSSTSRPTLRPPYVPRPPSINFGETIEEVDGNAITNESDDNPESESTSSSKPQDAPSNKLDSRFNNDAYNYNLVKTNAESMNVSTRSAIMAAGILGGVALSVFIAIFIVVKYRNHLHRHRRRMPLTLPSDSSTSSLPPIYSSRNIYSKECYQTSGFWTTLKKRFDPYSPSSSPTSM